MTELKSFETYLISGRNMKVEVNGNLVTIKITDAHEGMDPFDFEKEPSVFDAAIKKIEEENPDFEPVCMMLQLKDTVKYRFKRIR